jgi:uncharacterized protein
MIELNQVSIRFNFDAVGVDEIHQNVKTILTTPAGSVPLDREFGIDLGIIDLPIEEAKALLTVEYIEKIRRYEPRVDVDRVEFSHDVSIGKLIPKVVIFLV